MAPGLMRNIALVALVASCSISTATATEPIDTAPLAWEACPPAPKMYSPWASPPAGVVTTAFLEDFQSRPTPAVITCHDTRGLIPEYDVTSGCLSTVYKGAANQYTRGLVQGDVFRVVTQEARRDSHARVRWYHLDQSDTINWPGIKLFTRYQSEDDLYIAGFLADGRAQIKSKVCGDYATLAERSFPFPAAGGFHTVGLDAVGDQLTLTLDDVVVLTATDDAFTWGASGVRVDSFDGSYLDDWRVVP